METLIPELYRNYGLYVNKSKMLPSMVDGTIPVWKRILLGAHLGARKEFVKSAKIFGTVIGHWHPHTEAIEGTAEILVHNGFLDGKGNWGSVFGQEPTGCAAPRYTSLKMNEFIEKIAFEFVDDVEWKEDELDPEPTILPTMVPLCLFGKYEFNMIAFGFKTEIPNYKLSDLIMRLEYLLGKRSKVIIKPNIDGCKVNSSDEELEKLLTTPGKTSIQISGDITLDPKNYRLYIHGWSPRSNFETIVNRIDTYKKWGLFTKGDVGILDESSGEVGTKICLEVAKARNREKLYDQLVEAVKDRLTANISYNTYVVSREGDIVNSSVDQMLLAAYKYYTETIEKHFSRRITELTKQIEDLKAIEKIKPHLHSVFKLKDTGEMISKLAELSGLSFEIVEGVTNKYRIKKLLTVNTDISDLKQDIVVYQGYLKNPDTYSKDQYAEVLKASMTMEKTEEQKRKKKETTGISQITKKG